MLEKRAKLTIIAFPWLYPDGTGDFSRPTRDKTLHLSSYIEHLLRLNINGSFPFEGDPLWRYVALELTFKLRTMQKS